MAAFLYLRCNGGDYFTGSTTCPLDGWSGPGFVEAVAAADAMALDGEPVSMAGLRRRGVSEEALARGVIMEFAEDAALFDAVTPKGYVINGAWSPVAGRDPF